MIVFVCPGYPGLNKEALVAMLAAIRVAPSRATQIIAVDDTYDLQATSSKPLVDCAFFGLSNFTNQNTSNADGEVSVDPDKISSTLECSHAKWLLINLGYHGSSIAKDMIKEISRFCFVSEAMDERNIVFLADPALLPLYAREANDTFNSRAIRTSDAACPKDVSLSDIRLLFWASRLETLFLTYPILLYLVRIFYRLYSFIAKRILGIGANK